jgi:hypothetical protein
MRGWLRVGLGLALLALSTPAWPQPAGDPATARALFEEGTKALDKNDWDSACPKFDASFAAKPTVSALLNIAKCHDHAGKLTLAADDYQRALALNEDTLSQSRKKELADYATEALRLLKARIPRLRIVAKDAPPGLTVTRDGAALPLTALGIALPVDPGPHTVMAQAPGRRAQTYQVVLAEKAEEEVSIVLAADATPPPPAGPAPSGPVVPPRNPAADQPPPPPPRGTPAWAWVTGVAGLALGGVAIAFAVDGSQANCGGPCFDTKFTSGDVNALNARRHRDLGLGVGLGAAGAVGIAVGAWGLAASRGKDAAAKSATPVSLRPWIAAGHAGAGLHGGF